MINDDELFFSELSFLWCIVTKVSYYNLDFIQSFELHQWVFDFGAWFVVYD